MQKNKLAFFGTPYVARDTFEMLRERGYTPALVVTSPDAKKGRGLELQPSETKAWADAHSFPVLMPEKIDDNAIEKIRSYGCDAAIVVAYGKLFPQKLIDAFPFGVLNIHYSLLPKYRGAAPVESALLHGEESTGVSIQRMTLALDAGDLIAVEKTPILPGETTRELRPRLIAMGANLLADSLPAFLSGASSPTPQNDADATFTKKIEKAEGLLDLGGNAEKNWNTYRAFAESPGTYFYATKNGKNVRVKITAAAYENGAFRPLRVTPEGKREMDYQDFLKGVS